MNIKPCPFCGGELMVKSTELQSNVSACEIRHVNPGKAFMDMCPMEIRYFKSKKEAAASANMRSNQTKEE